MLITGVIASLLGSLALNAYLIIRIRKAPPRQESYECRDLLRDLLGGTALIKIERIAPSDIFLRSPREHG